MQNKVQINQVRERLIFLSPTVQIGLEREANTKDFEILSGLGSGAFGRVFKVRHTKTKNIFAIKQISKKLIKSQNMINQIKNEIRIMYNLDHENIIKLYNHFEEEEYIYLIIEFAEGGQLWQKLNAVGRFNEETVKKYMRDIIDAVEYLHSQNPAIIHRDIKPENILLDKKDRVKIADFGWSNFFNDNKRITYCGTLEYLAPEMINESGHDKMLDIWSLGVLIFELLTGKAPFAPTDAIKDPKIQQKTLEDNILSGKLTFPDDFPHQAKDLVSKLLKKNPASRLTTQQMKEHPWLSSVEIIKPPPKETTPKITENDINMTKPDVFSKEEILNIANRKYTVLHSNTSELGGAESNKQTLQDSEVQKLINDLNNKLKASQDSINELQVKLSKKSDEYIKLKEEYEKILKMNQKDFMIGTEEIASNDKRKLLLIEEEKTRLKEECDRNWEVLKEKENIILKQNVELKKMDDLKKDLERAKIEKATLNEKVKTLQGKLENLELEYQEKESQDTEKKINLKNNLADFEKEEIIKGLSSTFDELKKKLVVYKETMDELANKELRIKELEKQNFSLKASKESGFKEVLLEERIKFDEELENLKKKHKEEILKLQEELEKIKENTNSTALPKNDLILSSGDLNEEIRSLKSQLQLSEKTYQDMKMSWELMKKQKITTDAKLKEQDIKLRDFDETIKKLKSAKV